MGLERQPSSTSCNSTSWEERSPQATSTNQASRWSSQRTQWRKISKPSWLIFQAIPISVIEFYPAFLLTRVHRQEWNKPGQVRILWRVQGNHLHGWLKRQVSHGNSFKSNPFREKFGDSAEILYTILNNIEVLSAQTPIIIACNKQDLQFSRYHSEIISSLEK